MEEVYKKVRKICKGAERIVRSKIKEKKIKLKIFEDEGEFLSFVKEIDGVFISDKFFAGNYIGKVVKNLIKFEEISLEEVERIKKKVKKEKVVVGFGGGRSLDMAKKVAFDLGKELYLIPSSLAQNAICSKNASLYLKNKKESFSCKFPELLALPVFLFGEDRLKKAGKLDALSAITAVEDVFLSREVNGEVIDETKLKLSLFGSLMAVEAKDDIELAFGLISQGFAMEGSSRYCSGAEHELEKVMKIDFFHGELTGASSLLVSYLYSQVPFNLIFTPSKLFEGLIYIYKRAEVLDRAYDVLSSEKFGRRLKEISTEELKNLRKRYTLWKFLKEVNLKETREKVLEELNSHL